MATKTPLVFDPESGVERLNDDDDVIIKKALILGDEVTRLEGGMFLGTGQWSLETAPMGLSSLSSARIYGNASADRPNSNVIALQLTNTSGIGGSVTSLQMTPESLSFTHEFYTTHLRVGDKCRFATSTITVLSSTLNNVDASASILTFSGATTDCTVTGFVNGSSNVGRIIFLNNPSTVHTVTLAHQSSSSSSGNRITCPGGVDYVIHPQASVAILSRGSEWVVLGSHRVYSNLEIPQRALENFWDSMGAPPYEDTFEFYSRIHKTDGNIDLPGFWRFIASSDISLGISPGNFWFNLKDSAVTYSKIQDALGCSVIGRAANSSGTVADITFSTDGHVLRRAGGTLSAGTLLSTSFANNTVPRAALANGSACSVIGRSANSTGAVADITFSTDGHVLRRAGTSVSAGPINLSNANSTTGTLPLNRGGLGITSVPFGSFLRGSSSGTIEARTAAQVLSDIGAFPSSDSISYVGIPGTSRTIDWSTNHFWELENNSAGTTNLSFVDPGRCAFLFLAFIGSGGTRTYNWPSNQVLNINGTFETSVTCNAGTRKWIVLVRTINNLYFKILEV